MEVILEEIGRKFNRDRIFSGITLSLKPTQTLAVLGSNGSGKSTLLQIISGRLSPTEGKIRWSRAGQSVPVDQIYRYLSMSAPWLELIEEFTLDEHLKFHCSLKPLLKGISKEDVKEILGFKRIQDKAIRYYSSGMKQRLRLALAFLSDSEMILLDEPCSNLDHQGMEWYAGLVERYTANRLVIVCSNHQKEEISFCTQTLNVNDYK